MPPNPPPDPSQPVEQGVGAPNPPTSKPVVATPTPPLPNKEAMEVQAKLTKALDDSAEQAKKKVEVDKKQADDTKKQADATKKQAIDATKTADKNTKAVAGAAQST